MPFRSEVRAEGTFDGRHHCTSGLRRGRQKAANCGQDPARKPTGKPYGIGYGIPDAIRDARARADTRVSARARDRPRDSKTYNYWSPGVRGWGVWGEGAKVAGISATTSSEPLSPRCARLVTAPRCARRSDKPGNQPSINTTEKPPQRPVDGLERRIGPTPGGSAASGDAGPVSGPSEAPASTRETPPAEGWIRPAPAATRHNARHPAPRRRFRRGRNDTTLDHHFTPSIATHTPPPASLSPAPITAVRPPLPRPDRRHHPGKTGFRPGRNPQCNNPPYGPRSGT